MSNYYAHETAIIDDGCEVGDGTKIWHYTHICSKAKIGKNCVLGQNVYIGPNVVIGDNVKIQNNVSVYEGITIEDNVFLGPSCVLTNDKYPKSLGSWKALSTLIKKGASIGANATIVCGVTIGENSLVGAGSVVTKDVMIGTTVIGNPAREMSKLSVGIIGCGTVGGAIIASLQNKKNIQVYKYDKFKNGSDFKDISGVSKSDIVFISVPTPFDEDRGVVNTDAVFESFRILNENNFSGIVILKSTVPPSTSRTMQAKYKDMTVVFNPEFLREKTAVEDFYNQKNIVFGVQEAFDQKDDIEKLFNIILNDFNNAKVTYLSYEEAEMIKYSQNLMFSMRVLTCNVIYDACKKYNVDYNIVKESAFYNEPLIGRNIVEVPGPDGKRGIGGKCLPKDLAGFLSFSDNEILKEALKYNKSLGRKIE